LFSYDDEQITDVLQTFMLTPFVYQSNFRIANFLRT